ncbi:hypothetical protein [Polaribacter sp.]|uniref:hypothetical protein n=1 Tax=Polaribacter sp. TaxID=1920175 RepID=UPI003F6B54FC
MKIVSFFLFLYTLSSFSQRIIDFKTDKEYSDTLDIQLLNKVCNHLNIKVKNVYVDKSHSLSLDEDKTFFAIQYILKNTKEGNLYTTKYLFTNTLDGSIIDEVNDSNTFYDTEAVQSSPSYILKKKINLNTNSMSIAVITEESTKSCANLYSEQKMMILSLINNKIIKLLDNYTIRKTNGESNCSGNYKIEIVEKSIDITKEKSNGFFNLHIAKHFAYEEIAEENLDEGIKGKNTKKYKTESEKLTFNGENYHFEKEDTFRFLDW